MLQNSAICAILIRGFEQIYARRTNKLFIFGGYQALKDSLKTYESLRAAAARWLLHNDIKLVCCENNELGKEFIESFTLPDLEETRGETFVGDEGEIVFVMQSCLRLPANRSVSGRQKSFVILRYVRAYYDDYGNVYKYETLGYNF